MKFVNNKNMKNKSLYKNLKLIIPISILLIISLLDMYGASFISPLYSANLKKQILWILLGIVSSFVIYKIDMRYIKRYSLLFYLLGCAMLLLVLFIGKNVNGASSWFSIGPFSMQPSELFKPFFIVFASLIISKHKGSSITLLLKILFLTFIPAFLIFLEPDTGVVLMYLLLMLGLILASRVKKYQVFTLFFISIVILASFFGLYFLKKDLFISLFGTSFFYRMDRLLNFANNSSYQLNNALIGIGSSGAFGYGLTHSKIYVPEITTDFVYDLSILNFGYIMGTIIVLTYTYILYIIYKEKSNSNDYFTKCILSSIFYMMLFQIFEHIFMNLGITPITGITLPFLSYGGSSMISYFIILSLILKCIKSNKRM